MTWKVRSVVHQVTILVDVTPARVVRNQAGVEYRVEWVEFVYENGQLANTADGIGMNVLGRRYYPGKGGIPTPTKPARCFLLFVNHPWLDGMRRTMDRTYAIGPVDERPDPDADPAAAGAAVAGAEDLRGAPR